MSVIGFDLGCCAPCHACPAPVCLDDDPAALCDECGEVCCEEHQGGHECGEGT